MPLLIAGWEGAKDEQARKPALLFLSINNASGVGLINIFMPNKFIFFWVCTLCMCFFTFLRLHAQHSDTLPRVHNLVELEVIDDASSGSSLQVVPVQVMSGDDIARLGLENVADGVKRMAGVQVQDYGGLGGLKTVSLRGLGAKHTAVCYDGVAVCDVQSGMVDVGRFNLDNVSSLSLVMGQGEEIFLPARSYASAGAINIVTKRPLNSTLALKLKGGSFGQAGLSLLRERVLGDSWSYSASLAMQRADGDYPFTLVNGSEHSEQRRADGDIKTVVAEGNVFGTLGRVGDIAVKLYYFDSERGLPGAVNLYNKDNRERLWDNNFMAQAVYNVSFDGGPALRTIIKYNYAFSRYTDRSSGYSHGVQKDCNTQNEYYASLGAVYDVASCWSFALTSDFSYSSLKNNFVNSKEPERFSSQSVLATKYASRSFTATASLLATFIADRLKGGYASPADKRRLSPAVALSWQPLRSLPLRLRASYKDILRVPTFADLYYLRMGNVGLKPERASQFNAGAVYSGRVGRVALALSVDGYYNRVKDKIVALPTMYIWRMQNYGRVDVKGVDVTASLSRDLPCGMGLLADVAYSFCDAVDKTNSLSKNYGHQIPYTPRHTGSFSFTLNNPLLNVTYLLSVVGERYMLPQNSVANKMPSYVEHSLSANRDFELSGAVVRVQGELLNFTDKGYEVIRYYPMPGVSWRLSVNVTF